MSTPENEVMTYVLDEPEKATAEIIRLRRVHSVLITYLTSTLTEVDVPMPTGLDLMALATKYAERSGYATATIRGALADLQSAQK